MTMDEIHASSDGSEITARSAAAGVDKAGKILYALN
jgi:hypothetical protein